MLSKGSMLTFMIVNLLSYLGSREMARIHYFTETYRSEIPRNHKIRSLEPVVWELDVVAQVAADEKIRNERDPQQPGDKVAERDAEGALRGE